MRALVIAEACNPQWTSVPLVGYSLAEALRSVADVHVVTQVRNRDALAGVGWHEGKDFTIIDNEWLAKPLHRISTALRGGTGKSWTTSTAIGALAYYAFEFQVWRHFQERLEAGEFDIVHRVTPVSPTHAGPLASRLKGLNVPYVIGPINGGLPWPAEFGEARRREGEWLSHLRGVYRHMPYAKSTLKNASVIVPGSTATLQQLPASYHHKCVFLPENAVNKHFVNPLKPRQQSGVLKAVFVGRLVPYKGADMMIEAMTPLLKRGAARLDVIGDGPERARLENLVRDLQVDTKAVNFTGWIAREEVQRLLEEADVMPFPSIREFGGAVVLEAMAAGAVPIVVDYGGPGDLIKQGGGIAIPLGSRSEIIACMSKAITKIHSDPAGLEKLRVQGWEMVANHFTWETKARQLLEIYHWATGPSEKPRFF